MGAHRTRLGFDALSLWPDGSGVQTYIVELLRALAAVVRADLLAAVCEDAVGELPGGVETLVRRRTEGVRMLLTEARGMGAVDLVHGLDVHIPVRSRVPAVATVHDLAVYDVPWAFTRRWVLRQRAVIAHAARRADALVAVSPFTAERIGRRFGRQAVVIPEAPSPELEPPGAEAVEQVRRRHHLPDRFVLCVATLEPRKDLATLDSACRDAGVPLVLAGRASSPAPGGARHLGYVPGEELAALYGAATVVAYPSLYEGFGLPPIEAMACGAPVVCYRIPPIEELVGDAAVLTAPRDVEQLTVSLRQLLADDERRLALGRAGRARAGLFSWSAAAAATAEVYRSLGVQC